MLELTFTTEYLHQTSVRGAGRRVPETPVGTVPQRRLVPMTTQLRSYGVLVPAYIRR